jgi:hypothetical protein
MANFEALTEPATAELLDAAGASQPRSLDVRLHRGLLRFAAAAGFDAAYDLLADPARQAALVSDKALASDVRLHVARIRSGQAAADPEAHFQLAIAALEAAMPDEAAAAVSDCADNAAPYEKRDFARRLTQIAAADSDAASALPRLLAALEIS